jgi:hypothetical protein
MPTELAKRFFNIWVDMDKAGTLEKIASEKGVGVSEVVQEILSPALDGEDESERGRFILLRVPDKTYRQYVKFFEGEVEFAKQSMLAHIELGGEDFADAMRKVEGK